MEFEDQQSSVPYNFYHLSRIRVQSRSSIPFYRHLQKRKLFCFQNSTVAAAEHKRRCSSSFEARVRLGKIRRDVFILLFVFLNIAIFLYGLYSTYLQMQTGAMFSQFTFIFPWAKAFGLLLDFNGSLILLPVCKTLIRITYKFSMENASILATLARVILWIFPLDKALMLHEKLGFLILMTAFGHSFAHLFNMGLRWEQVISFYGWSPLITGFLLWIVLFLMLPAVRSNIKRVHFELFWITHQFFWVFIFVSLLHGRSTIGPNFWKFLLFSGAVYLFERIYREYAAQRTVSIISVTNLKDSILVLELSKASFPDG